MLSMQSDLQGQLAAKDEQMKALVQQVSQLTSNVIALTKKVTESDGTGGSRRRTRVRFAADKENEDPNVKAAAGKYTRSPWLLKMSNKGRYCWSYGYNPVGNPTTARHASARRRVTRTTQRQPTGRAAARPTSLSDMVLRWERVTKGTCKNSNDNQLIKAKLANYFPYARTNIVRTVTIVQPRHNASTSGSSQGHSPEAKVSKNNRSKLRKQEQRCAFASIDKTFAEAGAWLDAELKAILSDNDRIFEIISNILDTAKESKKPAESTILDSAATSSCCPTRANLKKTGGKSN